GFFASCEHMLDKLGGFAQVFDGATLLETEGIQPSASHQAQVRASVRGHIERRYLAGDLERMYRPRIQRSGAEPHTMNVLRHPQQRPDCRLKEQVVVHADHIEGVPIDRLRERDVVGGPLVGLECDAELHVYIPRRKRGSSASRTPSPMKLKASARVRIASPGKALTHHWSKFCVPAATMAPHSGAGGGEPRPRKLRPEKISSAFPRSSVAMTTAGAMQLGSTARVSRWAFVAPIAREACTYSFSFTPSTRLRNRRA